MMPDHRDGARFNRDVLDFNPAGRVASPAAAPGPIFRLGKLFVVDGHPLQFVGERWRQEDAGHAPAPAEPDGQRPGLALVCYLRDVMTGRVICPVSAEEFARAVDRHRLAACFPFRGTNRPG